MKLNRGINLGGYLSQCEHNEVHYQTFIGESDIRKIVDWGFDHVRLPIDYEVFEEENGETKEAGYFYVDRVVDWCKQNNLNLVLDLHKAYGYDFNDAGDTDKNNLFTNKELQNRFIGLWKKIAARYMKYDFVAFELLNEVVEEENAVLWNALISDTVEAIREVAPVTPIIYGGIQWNSAKTLKLLEKPKDKNIIFTFHFYEPLLFTHQKAHWVAAMDKNKTIDYPESMEYYRTLSKPLGYQGEIVCKAKSTVMGTPFIEEMVLEAIEAAKEAGVSLYCGEFGVIDKAPWTDTLQWFKDVDEVFRKHQISCAVWNYKEMDFGFCDEHYSKIRKQLLATWLPEKYS